MYGLGHMHVRGGNLFAQPILTTRLCRDLWGVRVARSEHIPNMISTVVVKHELT